MYTIQHCDECKKSVEIEAMDFLLNLDKPILCEECKQLTMKKTWKIGEYCKGGVLVTEISGDTATVIAEDWDFSAGSTKNSNQDNAKEFSRISVSMNDNDYRMVLELYLTELTTAYYASEITDWFKANHKQTTI